MLMPGGAAYKAYRTGGILKGAVTTGLAGATEASISEIALHNSQITRTYGESAVNIGGSAFISGVFGAGAGAIRKQMGEKAYQKFAKETEEILNQDFEKARDTRSVGAAEVADNPQVLGAFSKKAAEILGTGPIVRTLTNTSKKVRQIASQMAEAPFDLEKGQGLTTEGNIRLHTTKLYEADRIARGAFDKYRKRLKGTGNKPLKRTAFEEQVGKALYRGDDHDIPEVAIAAKGFRSKLYDPLLKEATDAGLIEPGTDVATALSYLNRVYKKESITACLLYTSPSPRDGLLSRMPSSA